MERHNFTIAAVVLLTTLPVGLVRAANLFVNPAIPGAYSTIQSAVDAAAPGDTIVISAHPDSKGYRENVQVTTAGLKLVGKTHGAEISIRLDDKVDFSRRWDPFAHRGRWDRGQRCPDVVLDGCETPASDPDICGATVLSIQAANVSVTNLTFRHGNVRLSEAHRAAVRHSCFIDMYSDAIATTSVPDTHEEVYSDSVVLEGNIFQGGSGESVDLAGNDVTIKGNVFIPTDNGIDVDGDRFLILDNLMITCNDECIDARGDDGRIENNGFRGGDTIIDVDGDRVEVLKNTLYVEDGDGIAFNGEDGRIAGNTVYGGYQGVDAGSSDGLQVLDNQFIGPFEDDGINISESDDVIVRGNNIRGGGADDDDGLHISGNNALVENNIVTESGQKAFDFSGENSTFRKNVFSRSGTESRNNEYCVEISGEGGGNLFELNIVEFCGFGGIRQEQGDNNRYLNNIIGANGRGGIVVTGGNGTKIVGNRITRDAGEGVALLGGEYTEIEKNIFTRNRTDICNNDTLGATETGNVYSTGGLSTSCVVAELP